MDFEAPGKVLEVHINDKMTFSQQFPYATNKALQSFGSINQSFLKNNSMEPNTFKTLSSSGDPEMDVFIIYYFPPIFHMVKENI